MEFRVRRAPRIEAEITVPGDKSISHRAVILDDDARRGTDRGAIALIGYE